MTAWARKSGSSASEWRSWSRGARETCAALSLALFLNLLPSIPSSEDDTIGDLKKLVAAQTGTRPDKIRIQKWHNVFKASDKKRERKRAVLFALSIHPSIHPHFLPVSLSLLGPHHAGGL